MQVLTFSYWPCYSWSCWPQTPWIAHYRAPDYWRFVSRMWTISCRPSKIVQISRYDAIFFLNISHQLINLCRGEKLEYFVIILVVVKKVCNVLLLKISSSLIWTILTLQIYAFIGHCTWEKLGDIFRSLSSLSLFTMCFSEKL